MMTDSVVLTQEDHDPSSDFVAGHHVPPGFPDNRRLLAWTHFSLVLRLPRLPKTPDAIRWVEIASVKIGDGARRIRRKADGSYRTSARLSRAMTEEERVEVEGGDAPGWPVGSAVRESEIEDFGTEPRRRRSRQAQMVIVGALAIGGVLGAVARYAVSLAIPTETGQFPWGTFVINISASFILGFVLILLIEAFPRGRLARPVIGTGIIGGYSTFSTFVLDAVELMRAGHVVIAVIYLLASVFFGLLAVWIGMTGARLAIKAERWLQEEIE
jgi:fluoride exporter